jgi:hypothetical protein
MQALQGFITKGNNIYFCIRKQDTTMSKKEKITLGIFAFISVIIALWFIDFEDALMAIGIGTITIGVPLLILYIKDK